jgi:hypothetical protein
MDYSRLGSKAATAQKSRAAFLNPIPAGDYDAVFLEGVFGNSKKGLEMVTLTGKIQRPGDVASHGKKFKMFFVVDDSDAKGYGAESLYNLLMDWGVNIKAIKGDSDWAPIFDALEDARAKFRVRVKEQKDSEYMSFKPLKGERCEEAKAMTTTSSTVGTLEAKAEAVKARVAAIKRPTVVTPSEDDAIPEEPVNADDYAN